MSNRKSNQRLNQNTGSVFSYIKEVWREAAYHHQRLSVSCSAIFSLDFHIQVHLMVTRLLLQLQPSCSCSSSKKEEEARVGNLPPLKKSFPKNLSPSYGFHLCLIGYTKNQCIIKDLSLTGLLIIVIFYLFSFQMPSGQFSLTPT